MKRGSLTPRQETGGAFERPEDALVYKRMPSQALRISNTLHLLKSRVFSQTLTVDDQLSSRFLRSLVRLPDSIPQANPVPPYRSDLSTLSP